MHLVSNPATVKLQIGGLSLAVGIPGPWRFDEQKSLKVQYLRKEAQILFLVNNRSEIVLFLFLHYIMEFIQYSPCMASFYLYVLST